MHGFPNYCVSIALQQRGVITQAVVYDPIRNDLFTATKGAGAFLNDKRIRVTKPRPDGQCADRHRLRPGPQEDLDEYLKMFEVVTERCQGLRCGGSAALDLAYVAAGRLDGFFEKA